MLPYGGAGAARGALRPPFPSAATAPGMASMASAAGAPPMRPPPVAMPIPMGLVPRGPPPPRPGPGSAPPPGMMFRGAPPLRPVPMMRGPPPPGTGPSIAVPPGTGPVQLLGGARPPPPPGTVDVPTPLESLPQTGPINVFVGKLPPDLHDNYVRQLLEQCGTVMNWKRTSDPVTGKPKGFGYCTYAVPTDALRALKLLNGFCIDSKKILLKVDSKTQSKLDEFSSAMTPAMRKAEESRDQQTASVLKSLFEDRNGLLGGHQNDVASWGDLLQEQEQQEQNGLMDQSRGLQQDLQPRDTSVASGAEESTDASAGQVRGQMIMSEIEKFRFAQEERERKLDEQRREAIRERLRKEKHEEARRQAQAEAEEKAKARQQQQQQEEQAKQAKDHHAKDKQDKEEESADDKKRKDRGHGGRHASERSGDRDRHRHRDRDRRRHRDPSSRSRSRSRSRSSRKKRRKSRRSRHRSRSNSYGSSSSSPSPSRSHDRERRRRRRRRERSSRHSDSSDSDRHNKSKQRSASLSSSSSTSSSSTPRNADASASAPSTSTLANVPKVVLGLKMQTKPLAPKKDKSNGPAATVPVFAVEEEVEAKPLRELVPIDYTEEERLAAASVQERVAATVARINHRSGDIKSLINQIPTETEQLFTFAIDWQQVDAQNHMLIHEKMAPWITKKIAEYLGQEEPSMVQFIVAQLKLHAKPQVILEEMQLVLEEEAEVFVKLLWRKLAFEALRSRVGNKS